MRLLTFPGSKADPTWDVASWTVAFLEEFTLGGCHALAEAVARVNGLSVAMMVHRDGRLAHAAAFDPRTGTAYDALGARPVAMLRTEIVAAVGAVRMRIEAPRPDGNARSRLLTEIAAGLPWMPRPTGTPPTPLARLRELTAIA